VKYIIIIKITHKGLHRFDRKHKLAFKCLVYWRWQSTTNFHMPDVNISCPFMEAFNVYLRVTFRTCFVVERSLRCRYACSSQIVPIPLTRCTVTTSGHLVTRDAGPWSRQARVKVLRARATPSGSSAARCACVSWTGRNARATTRWRGNATSASRSRSSSWMECLSACSALVRLDHRDRILTLIKESL